MRKKKYIKLLLIALFRKVWLVEEHGTKTTQEQF